MARWQMRGRIWREWLLRAVVLVGMCELVANAPVQERLIDTNAVPGIQEQSLRSKERSQAEVFTGPCTFTMEAAKKCKTESVLNEVTWGILAPKMKDIWNFGWPQLEQWCLVDQTFLDPKTGVQYVSSINDHSPFCDCMRGTKRCKKLQRFSAASKIEVDVLRRQIMRLRKTQDSHGNDLESLTGPEFTKDIDAMLKKEFAERDKAFNAELASALMDKAETPLPEGMDSGDDKALAIDDPLTSEEDPGVVAMRWIKEWRATKEKASISLHMDGNCPGNEVAYQEAFGRLDNRTQSSFEEVRHKLTCESESDYFDVLNSLKTKARRLVVRELVDLEQPHLDEVINTLHLKLIRKDDTATPVMDQLASGNITKEEALDRMGAMFNMQTRTLDTLEKRTGDMQYVLSNLSKLLRFFVRGKVDVDKPLTTEDEKKAIEEKKNEEEMRKIVAKEGVQIYEKLETVKKNTIEGLEAQERELGIGRNRFVLVTLSAEDLTASIGLTQTDLNFKMKDFEIFPDADSTELFNGNSANGNQSREIVPKGKLTIQPSFAKPAANDDSNDETEETDRDAEDGCQDGSQCSLEFKMIESDVKTAFEPVTPMSIVLEQYRKFSSLVKMTKNLCGKVMRERKLYEKLSATIYGDEVKTELTVRDELANQKIAKSEMAMEGALESGATPKPKCNCPKPESLADEAVPVTPEANGTEERCSCRGGA